MRRGAVLVVICSDAERDCEGVVPGARHVSRNVLEWRCDPASPHYDPDVAGGFQARRADLFLVSMPDGAG